MSRTAAVLLQSQRFVDDLVRDRVVGKHADCGLPIVSSRLTGSAKYSALQFRNDLFQPRDALFKGFIRQLPYYGNTNKPCSLSKSGFLVSVASRSNAWSRAFAAAYAITRLVVSTACP